MFRALTLLVLALPAAAENVDRLGDPLPEHAVARLGSARLRQAEPVLVLAMSPDGKGVASRDGGRIGLWDATSGRRVGSFGSADAYAMAWSGEGLLAVADKTPLLKVMDAATGRERAVLDGSEAFLSLAWSADGRTLVAAGPGLRIWEGPDWKPRLTIPAAIVYAASLSISPDGRFVAAGAAGGVIRVWDAKTGEEWLARRTGADCVTGTAFTRDGKTVAAAGDSGFLQTWDLETGRTVDRFSVPEEEALGVALLDGDTRLAGLFGKGRVVVFDRASGRSVLDFGGDCPSRPTWSVAAGSSRLAVGGGDGSIRICDSSRGSRLDSAPGHDGAISALAFSPDGALVATCGNDGELRLWNSSDGRPVAEARMPFAEIRALEFSAKGETLFIGGSGEDGLFRWSAPWPDKPEVFVAHSGEVRALFLAPDGSSVTTANDGRRFSVWGADGSLIGQNAPDSWTFDPAVRFSPDGKRALTSGDTKLGVWDVATGAPAATIPGSFGNHAPLAWTPDGTRIACGGNDGKIRFFDPAKAAVERVLDTGDTNAGPIAISPDGSLVASGGTNAVLRFLDAASGKVLLTVSSDDGPAGVLRFSPDGKRLAASTARGTAIVWEVPSK